MGAPDRDIAQAKDFIAPPGYSRHRPAATLFVAWAQDRRIALRFIEPGKPNQNAYIERFNRTYRDEVLSAYLFESTEEVQRITDDWLIEYNELRRHDSLGRVPPRWSPSGSVSCAER